MFARLEDPTYGQKKRKVKKTRKIKESSGSENEAEVIQQNSGKCTSDSTSLERTEGSPEHQTPPSEVHDDSASGNDELARVTLEADRHATSHIGAILFPLVLGFALRTLIMDKHASWYSWVITTLTGCV